MTCIDEPNDPQFKVQFKNEEIAIPFTSFFWDIWEKVGYQLPKATNRYGNTYFSNE
jgi:hypothetical protein